MKKIVRIKEWERVLKIVLIIFIFNSCSRDPEVINIVENPQISQFSFSTVNNPKLASDIILDIEENKIFGRIPQDLDIIDLIPTFEYKGATVEVDGLEQVSAVSKMDFTNVVTYNVKARNGEKVTYMVDVTKFTGLPIIYITTDENTAITSKEDYIYGDVSIKGGRNFENVENSSMKIRGRGNSTWGVHPKKPYQMKFENKDMMLKMPEDKKWIFLAEYSDKTMMRNTIAFEMGYLSNLDWTPESTFAEVFVNNKYNGTYNISQKVEEDEERVNIGSNGYLLEIDQLHRLDSDDVFFYTNHFLINIKEPELEYESAEFEFAKDLLNDFETVLFGSQFRDPQNGYAKYIDVDSFIDWYLISEITKNQDSKSFSSIFLNVIPEGKIKMGPLWDFDLAFGNVNYSECEYPTGFWVKDHKWFARLFEDQSFVSKVKSRFIYFKNNQQLILDKMDVYAEQLKYSQLENDDVWGTIGNYVWPNPVVFGTYQEEVRHLKSWYSERMTWLENEFNNM